jgi:hypothetical protein
VFEDAKGGFRTKNVSNCETKDVGLDFNNNWLRISMDRISDSDSEDAGSIPAGVTRTESKEIKTA